MLSSLSGRTVRRSPSVWSATRRKHVAMNLEESSVRVGLLTRSLWRRNGFASLLLDVNAPTAPKVTGPWLNTLVRAGCPRNLLCCAD
jgi:hypothetical protein